MGLDVCVVYDVKIHNCATIKKEHACYKSDTNYVYDPENCYNPDEWTKVILNSYQCDHDEDLLHHYLDAGFISSTDNKFVPGEIIEWGYVRSFYYGAYSKWSRERYNTHNFQRMSDCDGYYSGLFLEQLQAELVSFGRDNLTEKQKEYYDLIVDANLKTTIILHQ